MLSDPLQIKDHSNFTVYIQKSLFHSLWQGSFSACSIFTASIKILWYHILLNKIWLPSWQYSFPPHLQSITSPYIPCFLGCCHLKMCSMLSVATSTVLIISINSYHISVEKLCEADIFVARDLHHLTGWWRFWRTQDYKRYCWREGLVACVIPV